MSTTSDHNQKGPNMYTHVKYSWRFSDVVSGEMLVTYGQAWLRIRALSSDDRHTFTELGVVAVIVVEKGGVGTNVL